VPLEEIELELDAAVFSSGVDVLRQMTTLSTPAYRLDQR